MTLATRRERERSVAPALHAHEPYLDSEDHIDAVSPNWLIITLPTAAALANINLKASLTAVALIGAASLLTFRHGSDHVRLTGASLIFPALGLTVALRPNEPQTTFHTILFALVCTIMALAVANSRSRASAMLGLVDGIGMLLIASVIVRLAGIDAAGRGLTVTGNIFTGGERVSFPLIGSIASGPTIAAAYLAAAIPIAMHFKKGPGYRLIGLAAALYVMIQGDRRSALVAAVLVLAMVIFAPKRFRQIAPWVIGLSLTAPLWLRLTDGVTATVSRALSSLSPLKRGGAQGADSLEGRFRIWSSALDYFEHRVGPIDQAFGFGTSGQSVSGASLTYRGLFTGQGGDRNTKSPHNSVLQILFDGGWIVAAGFVVTVVWLAYLLSRRSSTLDLTALAMLTSLSFVGATESVISLGYPQPVSLALVAIGMIVFSRESGVLDPAKGTVGLFSPARPSQR